MVRMEWEYILLHKTRGFVFIELMITACLAMIILAALIPLHLAHMHIFRDILMQSERRYQTQVMLDALSFAVRRAGFLGCARVSNQLQVVGYGDYQITSSNRLVVMQDAIIVRHASRQHAALVSLHRQGFELTADNAMPVSSGDILIISDCRYAEIFKVARVRREQALQKIWPLSPLHRSFGQDAVISRFEVNQFSLRHGSLYLENSDGSKTKLVDAPSLLQFFLIHEEGGLPQLRIQFTVGDTQNEQIQNYDITLDA